MQTIGIKQAASFLGIHPETLRRRAASGTIPGVKLGKSWRFLEKDLEAYFRSKYANPDASQGDIMRRKTLCHYTNAEILGGFKSATTKRDYKKALGLLTY